MRRQVSECRSVWMPQWLIAMVAAVILAGSGAGKVNATEFRVGFMPYVLFSSILVAKHNGWLEEELKKEGLGEVSVKWIQFLGGPATNEAFAAGKVDVAVMGDTPALIAKAAGQDTIAIGLSSSGPKTMAMLAHADSSVRNIADLKGRKVATMKGSSTHELLFMLLEQAKMKPSDIEFVNLGLADMIVALQAKSVDAVLGWEPLVTRLSTEGVGRIVHDSTGLKKNSSPIVANREFAKANPAVVRAYLRVIQRANAELRARPGELAKMISEIVGLKPEQTEHSLKTFDWDVRITPEDQKEFERSAKFLLDNGMIRKSFDVTSYIDRSYAP